MMRLYIESYMCQILMDHSADVQYCLWVNAKAMWRSRWNRFVIFCRLNGKWYSLSLKAQKLLPLMTMRCHAPCKLTAGKILVMSMRTFIMVRKWWCSIKLYSSDCFCIPVLEGVHLILHASALDIAASTWNTENTSFLISLISILLNSTIIESHAFPNHQYGK